MIKTLLAGTALFLVPFGAGAADLPVRTPAPAPVLAAPTLTWSGAYLGVQGGWQQQRDHYSDNYFAVPVGQAPLGGSLPGGEFMSFGTTKKNGVIGGVHAGYNHQSGSLVVGVEVDLEGTNLKYGYSGINDLDNKLVVIDPGAPPQILLPVRWGYNARIGVQGSLRARLGYSFDKALLYATGGLAVADVSHTIYDEVEPAFSRKFSDVKTGWTLGAGVQFALTGDWSARAEYRYTDLGRVSNNVSEWSATARNELTSHAVRIGVSYRFGGAAR
jgi:outer membrane immunogenic protein